ncbi:hypothetical protein MKW92_037168, partial [Papaver armeniacum]
FSLEHTYCNSWTYLFFKQSDFFYLSDVDEDKLGTTMHVQETLLKESMNPSWRLSLVVNEPLESISLDLGFNGNSLAEGLVVTTCLGGAFLGSIVSGSIKNVVGHRKGFNSRTENLEGMLLGRFLVGAGMCVGPSVASVVSPSFVRDTYGSFIQIATCLGLMSSMLIGIPGKEITGW